MTQVIDNLLYIEQINIENCIDILEKRFHAKKIYTKLGAVLLSINPYQYFTGDDNIYDFNSQEPVHIYRTLDMVFQHLDERNQVIIVSGESGSGKTETTKQIIHYLNHKVKTDSLLDKIEASGLVLEIFGNAPTQKNHNSSRFGKFIEVFYNSRMECLGMKTSVYLLEKTRVLNQSDFGRFHIFTQDRSKTAETLVTAGFSPENVDFVLRVVDIILEILKLEHNTIENPTYKKLLQTKTTNYQGEHITKEYTLDEFNEIRGILAMKLYDFLFQWLVDRMNNFYSIHYQGSDIKSIGILDIFGFEDLKTNSLEQLSINYANEIIQGLLNNMLIEDKIKLYNSEEIPLESVQITLNRDQIELIEQLFIQLDEECMLPRGSSVGFIEKLNLRYQDSPHYKINRLTKTHEFQLAHYAGDIVYQVEDFCKKNIDRANNEIDHFIGELFEINQQRKKKTMGKLKINSITNQFRNQLGDFIQTVRGSELYFIKCIKPNTRETPMLFEKELVGEQLRYNGVLQLIQILRQGYSLNYPKDTFVKDYGAFIMKDMDGIRFGKTRVFLTEDCYDQIRRSYLQVRLESAECLRRFVRTSMAQRDYFTKRLAVRYLENRIWSKYILRDYIYHRGAYRIQRFFQRIVCRAQEDRNRKAVIITHFIRGVAVRNHYHRKRYAISQVKSALKRHWHRESLQRIQWAGKTIGLWWRNYLRKKNDLRKQNVFLEGELTEKNKKICQLEKRVIELEQKLSRTSHIDKTILHERDHYIIGLKRDIDSYQNNIRERLDEKMRLTEMVEELTAENRILIRQISYMRRQQSQGWLARFFGGSGDY